MRIRCKKDRAGRRTKKLQDEKQKGHGDGRRKKSKTGEGGSYCTVQVGRETEEERRAK